MRERLAAGYPSPIGESSGIAARCAMARSLCRPGVDHDLGDVLLLVAPDLIHSGRLLKADAVRNDVAGVNLALLNAFEERLHVVLHVGLPHFHCDTFAESCAERDLIEKASINSWNGNGS